MGIHDSGAYMRLMWMGIVLLLGQGAAAAVESGHEAERQAVPVSAQLTLAMTVDAAMTQAPERLVPAAFQREADAVQRRSGSLLAGTPTVALTHQTDDYNSRQGLEEWEAALEMPLWRWGERQASRELAITLNVLTEAEAGALRLRVSGAVREALWELMLSEERMLLSEQAHRAAMALEQDVQRRVEAGDLARTDLLLIRDETLVKQDEYLQAAAEVRHARHRYALLTGLTERPAQINETLSVRKGVADDHPLLRVMRQRADRARAELAQSQQSGSEAPQLVLGTRRERGVAGEDYQTSIGVGVRIPFLDQTHHAPAVAAASRQLTEAESQWQMSRRELELAMHEAEHTLDSLWVALDLAQEQHRMASESLRMARIAFELGETDLVQLLRVQTRAFTAERTLGLRRLQLQQAIARYNQVAGEVL